MNVQNFRHIHERRTDLWTGSPATPYHVCTFATHTRLALESRTIRLRLKLLRPRDPLSFYERNA